jgi:hypothetical protein
MVVKIVPKFTKAQIQKELQLKAARIRLAVISRFQFIGETFIANARNNGNYKDRTGNLRSSIGYVILENGEQIAGSFPGSTNIGKDQGKKIITQVSAKFPRGVVLIVVAGMEYAAAVESRGRDVLTSSSIIADDQLRKAISALSKKIA